MKETGFVVTIKDGFAEVRVLRDVPSCCSGGDKKESFMVKARNLCNAEIGSKVSIEGAVSPSSPYLLIGLCIAGFIVGLISGDYLSIRFGFTGLKEILSLGLGIVVTLLVYTGFRFFVFKGKHTIPVVYEILA
ncbi:MAG: hypothetical protein LBU17_10670 [Treponema sp.]|jgi:hypothetical protein|nr:hypothetical protein [Treponema sp.]